MISLKQQFRYQIYDGVWHEHWVQVTDSLWIRLGDVLEDYIRYEALDHINSEFTAQLKEERL